MDYTDFSERRQDGSRAPSKKKKPKAATTYWWAPEDQGDADSRVHERIFATVNHLAEQQMFRTLDNLKWMRLYGNQAALGFTAGTYWRTDTSDAKDPNGRLTLNIIQSVCDTVKSKIAKNRPKPSFVTSGGNWSEQRKAKLLDKYCQGQFHEVGAYKLGVRAVLDSTVFGTGVDKVYLRDGKICVDRVIPEELLVDDADGIYGTPRSIYQRKAIPREVLLGSLDDFNIDAKRRADVEAAVRDAKRPADGLPLGSVGDMVEVVEAWHLPSSSKAKDGRHVIAIDKAWLVDEEWKREEFPFVFLRWAERLLGFWGQGLAEQLAGLQLEINKLLKKIRDILHIASTNRVYLERGSKIDAKQLSNAIGAIVYYTGTPPVERAGNSVPPELFEQLERLYQKAFEIAGVSQLAAQAKKPAGLDSGEAIRTYDDIETERFSTFAQALEQYYLDLGRQMISLAKEVPDFEVRAVSRKFMRSIKWKDVDLDDDKYVMQMFPTSSLPTTPAARQQTVAEWQKAGWISNEEARRLLDFPDLESSNNLAFAAFEDIAREIEHLLEGGDFRPPEPYQNLQLGQQMMQSAYLRARDEGAPEEVLDGLRHWMDEAAALVQKAIAAQTPPPQTAPPPGAPPMPLPPSPAPAAAAA
jgi:hypothetical protein